MKKNNALTLQRQRADAAKNPSKRMIAATLNFYAAARDMPGPVVPAARAKAVPWEHIEQVKVIKWWRDHCAEYELPEFALFAIPNAGKRSMHVGASMQAEGLRKGAPDLMLAVPYKFSSYHALFIEMKPMPGNGGTWEVEQQAFAKYLQSQGYRYELCRGAESAISTIKKYLGN